MKATILSVGTELLFGQVTNTNTVYLSRQLNLLGIDVMYHSTVGDNPERLADMMKRAFEDCDLVLTTGGLGPTQDDLTKEIACDVMGDELRPHKESAERMKIYFDKLGREMTENNWKQTLFPTRAHVFPNDMGTAPGFALADEKGKIVICMPGPPREMVHMFETYVSPYLEEKTEAAIYYRMLRCFGIGESKLETELLDLIDGQTDPTLATYAKDGECCVRVASKRRTKEEARRAVDEMTEKVKARVGTYIYSYDDENLADVVVRKLKEQNVSIACAESCTGGWFAKTLTDLPGVSSVFDRGIVTYSNRAKVEELGVSQETLDAHGAVSRETAVEMAQGLKQKTGCRMCLSVTGIAGPDGGTEEKPVGLIYFCAILDEQMICRKSEMRRMGRAWNRNYAVLNMLDMANELLGK